MKRALRFIRTHPATSLGILLCALVVAGDPHLKVMIEGEPVEVRELTAFARPTLQGVKAPPQIYFGVISPQP